MSPSLQRTAGTIRVLRLDPISQAMFEVPCSSNRKPRFGLFHPFLPRVESCSSAQVTGLLVCLLASLVGCGVLPRNPFFHFFFTEMEPTQAQTHQRKRLAGRITPRSKMPPYSLQAFKAPSDSILARSTRWLMVFVPPSAHMSTARQRSALWLATCTTILTASALTFVPEEDRWRRSCHFCLCCLPWFRPLESVRWSGPGLSMGPISLPDPKDRLLPCLEALGCLVMVHSPRPILFVDFSATIKPLRIVQGQLLRLASPCGQRLARSLCPSGVFSDMSPHRPLIKLSRCSRDGACPVSWPWPDLSRCSGPVRWCSFHGSLVFPRSLLCSRVAGVHEPWRCSLF